MTLPTEPGDWEAQALLPARLLAGTPPAVQEKLRRAERFLYTLILEGLGPEPSAPGLAHEVHALAGELFILLRTFRSLEGLEAVADSLDEALQETVMHLESLGKLTAERSLPPERDEGGMRPFARSLSRDPQYQEAIQALGECLATLQREPSRAEWLVALQQDLLWVRTVLERHIASRGDHSSLSSEESRLCSVASILAKRLQQPLEELHEIQEALIEKT